MRFSLIRKTTCLIGVEVSSAVASNASGLPVELTVGLGDGTGEVVAFGSASLVLQAAAISPRPRMAATQGNARRCTGVLMDARSLSSAARTARGPAKHLGGRAGRPLPREAREPLAPGGDEAFAQGGVREEPGQTVGDRVRLVRVDRSAASPATSGSEETDEVSTGTPAANPSSTGNPNPSYRDGYASTVAPVSSATLLVVATT